MRRLSAAGIQSAFQFYNINSYETVERLIRRGVYKGPLVMNWVAIGGGMDQPTIYSLANFLRAIPDGSMLTVESSMRNVLPINMMGMAMGLHVRCGIEDNLWNQSRTGKMTHGAADRAAGAHLARVRPRDRHRQGSARDLQDRRVLRHRRGDAGRQRLRAQPQGSPAGLTCARRPEHADALDDADRPRSCPGLRDARRRALADAARGAPARAPAARCAACRRWAATTSTAPRAWRRSSARRSRSRGRSSSSRTAAAASCSRTGRSRRKRAVHGALLATPPDFEQPMPEGYPTLDALARRRLAAGAARARCRSRASSPPAATIRWAASSASPSWRATGAAACRPRRGRPPEPGLGLRRLAARRTTSSTRARAADADAARQPPDSASTHRRHDHGQGHSLPRDRRPGSPQARDRRGRRARPRPGARAPHLRRGQLHRHLLPHRPLSAAAAQRAGLATRSAWSRRSARA